MLVVPSYLCLLIYVTEGEKASIRQPKVMLMLAYEYKQA
jgi:hypothetical protein